MEKDWYDLFTRCHRLYVQGLRRAFKNRLEAALGLNWWDLGVLPALTPSQQESLRVGMEREKRGDKADYLDSAHFMSVVKRNHAAGFADAFPDIDAALGRFRRVAYMRNEWAHVPPEGLDAEKATDAIAAMLSLLISLRCRESLEVEDMTRHEPEPLQPNQRDASDSALVPAGPVENEVPHDPISLWGELQSYLAVDSFVLSTEDERSSEKLVKVRVSNVAPAGEGRPDIHFREVRLSILTQGRNQSIQLGRLDPGQAVEKDFTFESRELASVVFEVEGNLDSERFFRLKQRSGLPSDVVTPLLEEFAERFAHIHMNDPLSEALALLTSVGLEMTLAEAGVVRQSLHRVRSLVADTETNLQELFHEFHLNKQTRLGAHCHEAWLLLREVGSRIEAVDAAIESTDAQAAIEAVSSLEELQLAILQIEETTRTMGA